MSDQLLPIDESKGSLQEEKEPLVFYTTAGCHLCDQAKAVCQSTLNPDFFDIFEEDIAQSDDLIELYGIRIPVLKRLNNGGELGWPFNAQQLIEFLSKA